ncbi:hypothetical protein SAMN04488029_0389 [Reichenbachiella faecimaris]|uniref:Uncharacterized protein n=1 Tax=Reichenbachiella faecimaris TaxID=692418 RepID=A0A1W2G630_REIFA|nr:hypothetical protein [Reichenbachiella faecimaris]SMD32051.1 hypothetical protein SAMN04488029_0389 [Reichenbachiella faecimaris]
MAISKTSIFFLIGCFFAISCFGQQTISDKVASLHHSEKSKIRKPLYEFLSTWNTTAPKLKPVAKEIEVKKKENKQKGKDPLAGTKKLQETYDELVVLDGTERSFIAESFALPMQKELEVKGASLDAEDIYAVQYITKFVLGVPRFNHGELDINDLNQVDRELAKLIETYPDNDAHNQEVDGHVIDIFREEAQAFWNSFVAENKAQYKKGKGKGSNGAELTSMNCGEKYKLLKEKGIMH